MCMQICLASPFRARLRKPTCAERYCSKSVKLRWKYSHVRHSCCRKICLDIFCNHNHAFIGSMYIHVYSIVFRGLQDSSLSRQKTHVSNLVFLAFSEEWSASHSGTQPALLVRGDPVLHQSCEALLQLSIIPPCCSCLLLQEVLLLKKYALAPRDICLKVAYII